ncbi:hypothetical protein FNV43_RR02296 [Rhamnella rubrinervis]|uniref:LRAT domain-containing protein n=1 Tax=Rhamnella rubrinervis TaxID=2594499 RepID=A0A8K0HSV6_9ROSA|nr:hypothetical protein FNV43_RR02296 [Rhamnella rubrinervis]
MGLISSKIGRDELRPGDHIYTWRRGYSYSHIMVHIHLLQSSFTYLYKCRPSKYSYKWIYVDDGKVIHLTRGPGLIIFSSSAQSSDDRVVCCDMEDFFCDGQLYRFEYGVSRFEFLMKQPGKCSLASSDPPEQVLHRASYLLEYGFGNDDLLDRNCEDFAIYCKTGHISADGFSGQITSLLAAFIAVTFFPYRFLPAGLIGVALVFCDLYCLIRLNNVGRRRRDFKVVAVEKLAHLSDLGEYSACTIWLLGHLYWRWTSVTTILL